MAITTPTQSTPKGIHFSRHDTTALLRVLRLARAPQNPPKVQIAWHSSAVCQHKPCKPKSLCITTVGTDNNQIPNQIQNPLLEPPRRPKNTPTSAQPKYTDKFRIQ